MSKEMGIPLERKLAATRVWWRTTRALTGTAWTVAGLILLALICYHLDRSFTLSAGARSLWRTLLMGLLLVGLSAALLRAWLRRLPDNTVASEVERRYPVLKERLLTAIDLLPALSTPSGTVSSGFSRPMTVALVEETRQVAADLDFRCAINIKPLRIAGVTALFMVGLLVVDAALAPEAFANFLRRMASPYADIAPWAQTRVQVVPGAIVLPRGEGLSVTVATVGVPADRCTLRYRQEGEADWKTVELTQPVTVTGQSQPGTRPDAQRKFTYRIPTLNQNTLIFAVANDGKSNERSVRVEDRPTLLNFRMRLHFPDYMHRPDQTLPAPTSDKSAPAGTDGNIAAPVGTDVEIQAVANKPLKTAEFVRDGKDVGPWRVESENVSGRLSVWKDGNYALSLTDRNTFTNIAPTKYHINALPDQTPNVQIIQPTTDIDLVPDGSLPLKARAEDDYGVMRMALAYEKTKVDNVSVKTGEIKLGRGSLPLPGPDGSRTASVSVRWNLNSVHTKPGEVVRFEVTATDGDTLNGPHTGRSSVYRVRVVSLLEMQKRLREQLNEEARALSQLRNRQIEAQKQLQQARMKPDSAALARAQEAQKSVAQEARSIAQRIGDTSAQLENNNLATKSEMQRREQAEQTLQNLAQQKMPATAEAIQKAQNSPAKSEAQRGSLQKADKQETENRQEIEKAQQMLSRTPPPEQLAQEAARLAQEQQRLADSARYLNEDMKGQQQQSGSKSLTPEQKAGMEMERTQQKEIAADTKRLQEQLEQAAKAAQERGQNDQAKALQKAAQQLKQNNATGNQQQAMSQLSKTQPGDAAPFQDKAANALQKAAQEAQKAADPSKSDSLQAAAERLDQAAEKLRQMAQKQREVANQTAQNPDAQKSRELAKQERNLQNQAGQAQQSLSGVPQAQKSVQSAQQNLSQSSQQLSQNSPQSAQSPAQKAAQQLEKAAQQANNAAQQMRQQQQAAELAEKVERLAQDQRALQGTTKRLSDAGEKGDLKGNALRELGQVAARQQSAEQKARDLASKFPTPAFQKAMDMAAQQMRPATRNLNQYKPDTGKDTQQAQNKAAQTLETIAQALKQQSQSGGGSDESGQQQDGGSSATPQSAQQAAALAELMLAQGLQKQVRQDTGQLDKERSRNPSQTLTTPQQRQAGQIAEGQGETQRVTESAGEQLESLPGVGEAIREATGQMKQARQGLNQRQTGRQTQERQESAGRNLEQAAKRAEEEIRKQQQQQQAMQQGQKGAPQPGKQPGSQPDKSAFTRLENPKNGKMSSPGGRNGNFADLSPRAQRVLREGQQEKAPAEFQALVNKYYKSLAENKK